jgi:hypothetical protein
MRLANVTASGAQPWSGIASNMARARACSPLCAHAATMELKMPTSALMPSSDTCHSDGDRPCFFLCSSVTNSDRSHLLKCPCKAE